MANLFETTGMDDPLGLWTPTASTLESAPGAVSFSVGGDEPAAPEAVEPVFRVNLPADGASATRALEASEAQIARLNAALQTVPSRLDGLVARTQERRQKAATSGVSFDTLSEEPEPGPEGDLLAMLASVEGGGTQGGSEVSFGLVDEAAGIAWEQAKAGFDALIQQISREVLHFAWVETNIADALLARTTIGWTGDAQTAFAGGIKSQQVALHNRTLQIVTQTRSMRLQLFITITSGAAKISTLIATPAGAVLALPAAYKYVMQIVEQVKQFQSIPSS